MADHGLAGHTAGVDLSAPREGGARTEAELEEAAERAEKNPAQFRNHVDDPAGTRPVDISNLGENMPGRTGGATQWERPERKD